MWGRIDVRWTANCWNEDTKQYDPKLLFLAKDCREVLVKAIEAWIEHSIVPHCK